MTAVTIVMPYYDNPNMLAMHLKEWSLYRAHDAMALRAVIVDDASPNSPAAEVFRVYARDIEFPISLFRIHQNKPWNQDGARNLAMKHVTGWALMTDMDLVLNRDQVPGLLTWVAHRAKRGSYYMPRRRDFDGTPNYPHPNSYIMHAEDFWHMGGYDEDFAGVYGSDGNFRKCMRAELKEEPCDSFYLTRWTTRDMSDANTREWGRKGSPYHRANFPEVEKKAKGPPYKATNHLRFSWDRVF